MRAFGRWGPLERRRRSLHLRGSCFDRIRGPCARLGRLGLGQALAYCARRQLPGAARPCEIWHAHRAHVMNTE
eukprot:3300931-Prymnesium_polylepis.2